MPTQTILSPGVQINEIDLSLRAVVPNGTNVLVLGFAQQGPIEEVFEIPDIQTFETIYGKPNNAAERYFYYSTRGVLDGGGRPIVSRLPYGDGTGAGSTSDKYSCLAYPVMPIANARAAAIEVAKLTGDNAATYTFSNETSGYIIGAPTWVELTESTYNDVAQNNIQWRDGSGSVGLTAINSNNWFSGGAGELGQAGIIVLNKFKSTFEQKTFEGYVLGLSDSLDANPVSDFTSVKQIKYSSQDVQDTSVLPGDLQTIPASRLNFALSSASTSTEKSISQELETQGENLNLFQGAFIDSISLGVFKLRQSIYTPLATTLDYTIPDSYTGSLNSYRKIQDRNGGTSIGYFLGDVEDNSTYVQVLVNPYISTTGGDWTNSKGLPSKFVQTYHSNSDTETKFTTVTGSNAFVDTLYKGNNPFINSQWGVYDVFQLSSYSANYFDQLPVKQNVPAGGTAYNTAAVGGWLYSAYGSSYPASTTFFSLITAYNDTNYSSPLTAGSNTETAFLALSPSTPLSTAITSISAGLILDYGVWSGEVLALDSLYAIDAANAYTGTTIWGDVSANYFAAAFGNPGTTLWGDLSAVYRALTGMTYTYSVNPPDSSVVSQLSTFGGFLTRTLPVMDSAYSYGVTDINRGGSDLFNSDHAIGNIPGKVDRVFQTIDDVDALRIDLSVEGGLGSIYSQCQTLKLSAYDDTIKFNIGSTTDSSGFYRTNGDLSVDTNLQTTYQGGQSSTYDAQTIKDYYNGVYTKFESFARSIRKDHMFIADPLRPFLIEGANTKILTNKSNTFVQHVYTPLRNLYDLISTSYAAVYANWAKIIDVVDGQPRWVPFSGLLAGMMAADDANFAPWYAPAGFTRGKIPSPLLDLAVSPSQRNRDSVYKIGINPITKFPNDGITVFGQKTQLSTPSAFDRINVRRLFLYLEKLTRSTMKYFVFEPNTVFTRTRVISVLKPQFDIVKDNEGMYDYLIVCDERNNTPEVIDQNQLIVDIYIKPTRAAEFILVNFYATRTDQDFNELI